MSSERHDPWCAQRQLAEPATDPAVTAAADRIMTEVHDDMREPFPWGKQIPRNAGSFSALHDYCDANCYLLDVAGELGTPEHYGDEDAEGNRLSDADQAAIDAENLFLNAVSGEVDRRLYLEARELEQQLADCHDPDFGIIDPDLWRKDCTCLIFSHRAP